MCIAICKPEGLSVNPEYLSESFKRNPDGAGFAYAEEGKLYIKKGLMTFKEFEEEFEPHKTKAAIIHFRIKTHGSTDKENTHPFMVGSNLAMIHNGIISAIDRKDNKNMSDTYHFNTKILSKLYKRDSRFIYKEPYQELVREYIGASKLVFINNKGHFQIINEKMGVWENEIWFSNTSYKPHQPIANQATTKLIPVSQSPANSEILSQGDRVLIGRKGMTPSKGTIIHFTGGLMVGVLIDGDTNTSLVHTSLLQKDTHRVGRNPFSVKDWVVSKDEDDLDIYEVTGTSKDRLWIRVIGPDFEPTGLPVCVDAAEWRHYNNYEDF